MTSRAKKTIKKKVLLNIIGEQSIPGGDVSRIEMDTEGSYYEADGIKYLEYCERDEDMPGSSTQLSVNDDIVSLLRTGEGTTHMVFKKGQKSFNSYSTPIGELEMAVLPTFMNISMNDKRGNVDLSYQLTVAGRYAGDNSISISYKSIR